MIKATKEFIYVFDMDNTLIKTNNANNIAYSEAVSSVLGIKCFFDPQKRFTREMLKTRFPEIKQTQLQEIIAEKEKSYESYLDKTELNQNLFKHLQRLYHEGRRTILLTNCHSGRAISLCNFYNLTKYFSQRFFYEDCLGNKYAFLKSLGYNLQNVVLYENEEEASKEAINNGVNLDRIIKIGFE